MSSLLSFIQRRNPSQLHRLAPSSSLSTLHKVESHNRLLRISRYQELQRYPLIGFAEVVFVEKPLTCPKTEVDKMHAFRIIGEIHAANAGLARCAARRLRPNGREAGRVRFPPSSSRLGPQSLPCRTGPREVGNMVLRRMVVSLLDLIAYVL